MWKKKWNGVVLGMDRKQFLFVIESPDKICIVYNTKETAVISIELQAQIYTLNYRCNETNMVIAQASIEELLALKSTIAQGLQPKPKTGKSLLLISTIILLAALATGLFLYTGEVLSQSASLSPNAMAQLNQAMNVSRDVSRENPPSNLDRAPQIGAYTSVEKPVSLSSAPVVQPSAPQPKQPESNPPAQTTQQPVSLVPNITGNVLSGDALADRMNLIATTVARGDAISDALIQGLPADIASTLKDSNDRARLSLKLAQDIQDGKEVSEQDLAKLTPEVSQKLRDLAKQQQDLQQVQKQSEYKPQTPIENQPTNAENAPQSALPTPSSSLSLNNLESTDKTPVAKQNIPDYDSFGVPSVPSDNSWASKMGRIEVPLPKGGDITSWQDFKGFGISNPNPGN